MNPVRLPVASVSDKVCSTGKVRLVVRTADGRRFRYATWLRAGSREYAEICDGLCHVGTINPAKWVAVR